MEFATRDRYRHVIERISKRTRADELEIARAAVELAKSGTKTADDGRRTSALKAANRTSAITWLMKAERSSRRSFAYRPQLG